MYCDYLLNETRDARTAREDPARHEQERMALIEDYEIMCQIIQAITCQYNELPESSFIYLTDRRTGHTHKALLIKSGFINNIAFEQWWLLSNGKIQHYQDQIMLESFIAENDRLALFLCGKMSFIDLAKSLNIKMQDNWQ